MLGFAKVISARILHIRETSSSPHPNETIVCLVLRSFEIPSALSITLQRSPPLQSQLSHRRDSDESDGSEQEPEEAGDPIKTYFLQTQPNFFHVLVMSLLLICMAGLIYQLNIGLGCV